MPEFLEVNKTEYRIIKLLGRGKGGYSYLAERNGNYFVLKQIHHEPCDYYSFGNKIEAENSDYQKLCFAGITVPKMLEIDFENERILKEYIEGFTVSELVENDLITENHFMLVRDMAEKAKRANINIDYFPTNFIEKDGILYYVDYECNPYCSEWNFENWGIKYWSKTPEFLDYLKNRS